MSESMGLISHVLAPKTLGDVWFLGTPFNFTAGWPNSAAITDTEVVRLKQGSSKSCFIQPTYHLVRSDIFDRDIQCASQYIGANTCTIFFPSSLRKEVLVCFASFLDSRFR
jgi:hypothetical protein